MLKRLNKTLCLLVALMLMGALALAESADIERFCDVWVDDFIAVEISQDEDDGAIRCSAVLGDGTGESEVWRYDACRYDAETDSLICEDGTHTREHYDDAAQELKSDALADGLTATFRFADGADALVWEDSEGLAKDYTLRRLSDAEQADYEEAQSYVGRWGCDRATIDITDNGDDSFDVTVTWGSSAAEHAEWHYTCLFDVNLHRLYSSEPGAKSVVTFGEDGEIVSDVPEYDDGEATFAIEDDGMLVWNDEKENAADGMRFERATDVDNINCLIEEGSFIIQVDVEPDDEGWQAFDMEQDDSVIRLYDADILEDTFVARYDPVGDGDVTVGIRHMNGIACDKLLTWDLRVRDGAVQEVLGGSHTESPSDEEMNPYIAGEWQVNDEIMAGMTIDQNPEGGWALEIAMAYPNVVVMRANMRYDCELDRLVYADGTFYESEITNTPDVVIGDVIVTDATGSLEMVQGADNEITLKWYNDLSPDMTATFARPFGAEDHVVYPMDETVDVEEGTYMVTFDREDLADGEIADVRFFTVDCYDIVDIATLAVGDGIVIEGSTIEVRSLSEDESGDKLINGGLDEGGYTLRDYDEDNCWRVIEYDDYNTYTQREVATLALAEDVTLTDSWDIDGETVKAEGADAVAAAILESPNDAFFYGNTTIRIEGGRIVEIIRRYVP